MNNIIENIKDFYDLNAKSFQITRKKIWPEFEHIFKQIKKSTKKNLKILELGCWDWRFAWFLESKLKRSFSYTWVDISENLINLAQNQYSQFEFITDNMNDFLTKCEQEKYDFIVIIAAFQHLPNKSYRNNALKNIYRSLKYWWELIMTNWSFSKWFLNKFKIPFFKAISKNILSLWLYKFNDLYIPWKDQEKTYFRYYHIFTQKELNNLLKLNSFIIIQNQYIDKNWDLSASRINSRNSLFIAQKNI